MNKKEAIKEINNLEGLTILDKTINFDSEMIPRKKVLNIIKQLDEQEKPVVPQFVAEWYEDNKDNFYGNLECRVWDKFELLAENNNCIPEKPLADDFTRWYYNTENAIQILVNMHQFGYEVEKEKLYKVSLKKNGLGIGIQQQDGSFKEKFTKTELSEFGFNDLDMYEIKELED